MKHKKQVDIFGTHKARLHTIRCDRELVGTTDQGYEVRMKFTAEFIERRNLILIEAWTHGMEEEHSLVVSDTHTAPEDARRAYVAYLAKVREHIGKQQGFKTSSNFLDHCAAMGF